MDCHWFKSQHCRSCELLDHKYAETIVMKEKKLQDLFANLELALLPSVHLGDSVGGSRNKAKLAVHGELNQIQFGFYDSQLKFKTLEECPLHLPGINELLPSLKKKLQDFAIVPYSLLEKKGELKYLIISKSQNNNELLVRFILRSKESLDRLRKMSAILTVEFPSIKVVTANIQPEHKAVLEGEEEIVLTNEQVILHRFLDVTLSLGPKSFFQVTPAMALKLYASVGEAVLKFNVKSFLDLYCGVGAFSFFAAQNCPDVFGVEISKEAIKCAEASVQFNQVIGQIKFQALDVEEFLTTSRKSYEAILVNPPRRGLNSSIVESIIGQNPKYLFYSSCNAETLRRDYQLLHDKYQIQQTQIFDMFPYTEHFETLMVMSRRDA